MPEIVHEISTGSDASSTKYLGVNYVEMVPLLLEAIRELDIRTSSMKLSSSTTSTPTSTTTTSTPRKRRKLAASLFDESILSKGGTTDSQAIEGNTVSRRKDDSRRIDTHHQKEDDDRRGKSYGRQENNTLDTATAVAELLVSEKAITTTTTTTASISESETEKEYVDMNCGDLHAIIRELRRRVVAIERDSTTLRRRLTTISSPITIR